MNDYAFRNRRISEAKRKSNMWFIERAINVHGEKYDYSKVEYINAHTKVTIKCKLHGDFAQRPHDHVKGKNGCPICWSIRKGKTQSDYAFSRFLEQAKILHNNKYHYKIETYSGMTKSMIIICPTHGEFKQSPDIHRRPHGCPQCGNGPVSNMSQIWLDSLSVPFHQREILLKTEDKKFKVDGFDPINNTVFEFLGDYWHGNPEVYEPAEINTRTNTTFKFLYEDTMQRIEDLKIAGFNVVFIWENDYLKSLNNSPSR